MTGAATVTDTTVFLMPSIIRTKVVIMSSIMLVIRSPAVLGLNLLSIRGDLRDPSNSEFEFSGIGVDWDDPRDSVAEFSAYRGTIR